MARTCSAVRGLMRLSTKPGALAPIQAEAIRSSPARDAQDYEVSIWPEMGGCGTSI